MDDDLVFAAGFESSSAATSDGSDAGERKLGNDIWHDSKILNG